jgi:hypothetical protein
MRKFAFLLILLSPSFCLAGNIDCEKLHSSAFEKGRLGYTYEGKITGKGRAYFHQAPTDKCLTKEVFLVSGDFISIYAESNGWLYLMYINKQGEDFSGWISESRIEIIGPYGK